MSKTYAEMIQWVAERNVDVMNTLKAAGAPREERNAQIDARANQLLAISVMFGVDYEQCRYDASTVAHKYRMGL